MFSYDLAAWFKMPRAEMLRRVDAEEYVYWRAWAEANGGIGETKEDRRWAFLLYLVSCSAGNAKSEIDDFLGMLNPLLKPEKKQDIRNKVQALNLIYGSIKKAREGK
jgi:hypothetical protein